MAFGDIGGAVTELVITMRTQAQGDIEISKGDPLALTGEDYEIANNLRSQRPVFGEALADVTGNEQAIPVKVRGISIFNFIYLGDAIIDGSWGVVTSKLTNCVGFGRHQNGATGTILKIDEATETVHVLL